MNHHRLDHGTEPFPWWTVRDFFPPHLIAKATEEILPDDDARWQRFANGNESKWACGTRTGWGPATAELADIFANPAFAHWLEALTGIDELTVDFTGGGIHRITPGGFLGTHIDFNHHPTEAGLYRRLNCLLFLRTISDRTGALELRREQTSPMADVVVPPVKGMLATFATSETSWHGHPVPLSPGPDRLSFAAYFYAPTPPQSHPAPAHSTIFAS